MNTIRLTELIHITMATKVREKFQFRNEMLYGALTHSNKSSIEHFQGGYTLRKYKSKAYIYLVLCAREAFNIRRYPLYEDRNLLCSANDHSSYLESLCAEDITNGAKELYRLWDFTQNNTPDCMLKLKRNISIDEVTYPNKLTGYAAQVVSAKLEAEKAGHTEVVLEMDTINGYTLDGNKVYGDVQIEMNIPKKDILFFGDDVEDAEEREIVVLNRDPRGNVSVPVEGIFHSLDPLTFPEYHGPSQINRIPYIRPDAFRGRRTKHRIFTKIGMTIDRKLAKFYLT